MGAGIVWDEQARYYWLNANPANTAAPTLAEINAGLDLTEYMPPDGFQPNMGNSRVNGADAKTKFDAESMGRFQAAVKLTLKRRIRGTNAEAAWTTLGARGVSGCFVVLPFANGPAAVADKAYVFPTAETGMPLLLGSAENAEQRFDVDLAIGSEPNLQAVVA